MKNRISFSNSKQSFFEKRNFLSIVLSNDWNSNILERMTRLISRKPIEKKYNG